MQTENIAWRLAAVLLAVGPLDWIDELIALLRAEGLVVTLADPDLSAEDALALDPDVIVVDLALPDDRGLSLCAEIRWRSPIPILAVASPVVSTDDVVASYGTGIDMLSHRETTPRILTARIRALLRRVPPRDRPEHDRLSVGPIAFDWRSREAWFDDTPLALAAPEIDILEALVRSAGFVVAREQLQALGWDGARTEQSLDVHIRSLRTKLEAFDGMRRIITVRGVGFMLVAGDARPATVEAAR